MMAFVLAPARGSDRNGPGRGYESHGGASPVRSRMKWRRSCLTSFLPYIARRRLKSNLGRAFGRQCIIRKLPLVG